MSQILAQLTESSIELKISNIINNMSNLGQNVYMDIQPSNVVSTGRVSYRNGNPVIQFIIGENDIHLAGSSVRFCGNIQFFRDANRSIQTEADGNLMCLDSKIGIQGIDEAFSLMSLENQKIQ